MDDPIQIPITDTLDLHTISAVDLKPVVEEYLIEARKRGFRALRLIHGKGIGVRREIVRSILARTPGIGWYGDAPDGSGWGATVVELIPLPEPQIES